MRKFKKHSIYLLIFTVLGCGNSVDIPNLSAEDYSYFSLFSDAAGVTMTNASAAGTELTNNVSRAYVNLQNFTSIRGQFVSSLTSTTVQCRIEYSTNDGSSWDTLVPNFSASAVANQISKSNYASIPSAAKADVLVRALIVGDGVLDPVIRFVRIDFYD